MPDPITPSTPPQRSTQPQSTSASSSLPAKPPLSLLEQQAAELTRLGAQFTLQTKELLEVKQERDNALLALRQAQSERDQALELVKSSQQALTSSRQALTASEDLLRADELIEFEPSHWLRPSGIREVETWSAEPLPIWERTNGKWEQQLGPDGKVKTCFAKRIRINGEERLDRVSSKEKVEMLLGKILKNFAPEKPGEAPKGEHYYGKEAPAK